METSLWLAQLIGWYFVIMAIAVLVKHKELSALVQDFMEHRAHGWIVGFMSLLIGLLITTSHNIWEGDLWLVIITIVGWLSLLKGIFYLWMPQKTWRKLASITNSHSWYVSSSVALFVIGIYLLSQAGVV